MVDPLEEDPLAAEAVDPSEVQAAVYLAVTCRPRGNNCIYGGLNVQLN